MMCCAHTDNLDSSDWQDQERQAIQEGIDAWRAGDTQDFDQFDAEFRARDRIQQAEVYWRALTGSWTLYRLVLAPALLSDLDHAEEFLPSAHLPHHS
jgi:hypothetical protein